MRSVSLVVLVLLLALAACSDGDGEDGASPSPPLETATATPTAHPSATPRPTATPTVTPTPQPAVEAVAQSIDEDGALVASRVYAPQDGWLAAYADDGGQPGELLAHVAVAAGEQRDVALEVDPYRVTPTLHLRLHADTGEEGAFEFPDADELIEQGGEAVGAAVEIELLVAMPTVGVSDQAVSEDGIVVVDTVTAAAPGWVAVHADDEGQRGALLGLSPVPGGESSDVSVRVPWRDVTRRLHAVLYSDGGEPGLFEPQDEEVVQVNGQPVQAAFTVQAPPDVYALNQPVVAAEIVVERAFINEAGWIAVFSNYEGFTDRLLGYAPLEAGESTRITVPIDPSNSTDILHVQLHVDEGVEGDFEYPAGDPPLLDDGGQAVRASIETDTGNYLVTRDQPLGDDGTVTVPLVVSDLDTWVVVWSTSGGEPDEIMGQTLVERGVRRDVVVEIDADAAGEILLVALHQDAGTLGEFEYPGPDEILQRERSPIQAPLNIGG